MTEPAPDLTELISEYESTRDNRRSCIACDSPHRALLDELLRRGGGSPSIARFMKRRLDVDMSQHTLQRHKSMHLDAGSSQ